MEESQFVVSEMLENSSCSSPYFRVIDGASEVEMFPITKAHYISSSPQTSPTQIILDEDDVFQCGRCKKQFSSLDQFVIHKRDQCSGIRNLISCKEEQGLICSATDSVIEIKPSHSELQITSSEYERQKKHDNDKDQQIIIEETEFLPFDVESAHTLPLVSDLPSSSYMSSSESSSKALPTTVPPLLMSAEVLEIESNSSFPSTLEFVRSSPKPLDGCKISNCNVASIDSSANDSAACSNTKLFHGKMAKCQSKETKQSSKHTCPFCQKQFAKNYDLQQHIRAHTGEKPFQCVVCGRSFAQKSNVTKHMTSHKVWPGGGLCNTLPKQPLQKVVFKSSMDENVTVVLDNSYVCQFCGASYLSFSKLRSHMKKHSHKKVYQCIQKDCESTFVYLEAFLAHLKNHRSLNTSAIFACRHLHP